MNKGSRVLVFEDLGEDYARIERDLRSLGFHPQWAESPEKMRLQKPYTGYELIIIDLYRGPRIDGNVAGIDLLREVRSLNNNVAILVASNQEPTRQLVADAFRYGANDYVDKRELFDDFPGVIARTLDRARNSEESQLEVSLPLPMAFLFRDFHRSRLSPKGRLERMVELFEVALKLATFTLMSANRPRLGEILSGEIRQALAHPSLGHFALILKRLPEPENFTRPLWAAAQRPRFRELVNQFISLRNDYIGHGIRQADAVYERQLREYHPRLNDLLGSLADLQRWTLVVPIRDLLPQAGFKYEMRVYRGANPVPTLDERDVELRLQPGKHPFLISSDFEESLDLFPWCQYLVCEERCLMEKLFLFQRARSGQLHMLDHVYGHAVETRLGWELMHQLIGSD